MPELDFNTQDYKGEFKSNAIPEGRYKLVISDSQRKQTKSGTGAYLALTLEVVEGEYNGARIWVNLNLWNPSEAAVRIAREEFTAVAKACGVPAPRCSEELHNIPFFADVAAKTEADGRVRNSVNAYYSIARNGAAPKPAQGAPDVAPYKRPASGQTGWGK